MPARLAIAIIVLAEFFGTSLWFSANAVADSLHRDWGLTVPELGHLTSAVQLGFISGTFLIAFSGLADRYSASRIFAICALLGAAANAAFALASAGLATALVYRFITGLALAGIYPIGMKLVVSWAPQKAGNVLGWLVGMLVFGSGLPHLVRGLDLSPTWQGVVIAASAAALLAALMVGWLGDGPHHAIARRLQWGGVLRVFRIPDFRAAALGYFGHMWELYAFYAVVPLLIAHWQGMAPTHEVYLIAAGVFAAGGVGCILGGVISRHWGSARVAIVALAGSAGCCLFYPLLPQMAGPMVLALLLTWGFFCGDRFPAIFRAGRRRLSAGAGRQRAGAHEQHRLCHHHCLNRVRYCDLGCARRTHRVAAGARAVAGPAGHAPIVARPQRLRKP